MYEFLLSVHLLAAIVWIGGGVTMHIFGRMARAAGGERMVIYTREANKIGSRFYSVMAFILLVAGLLLVDEAGYEFSDLWISLSLAAWVLSFLIGVGFYGAHEKKLEAAAAAEGPDGPGVREVYDRVATVNMVELSILLLIVVDMVVKPGA